MSTSDLQVIVGLGATGLSCARYLIEQGATVAITDSRINPPHLDALQKAYPDLTVSLGKLDLTLLQKAARIVLSPGISLREPAIAEQIKRGIPVLGDIELFAQAVKAPVLAITGTNAKSTVTTLVGKMAAAAGLSVEVGGNLGVPALDLLLKNPKADLFVLELSSFQLETTQSLSTSCATVLNVSPDHMDRYETLTDYQRAKLRIYERCQVAVCNRDDPLTECHLPVNKKLYFTVGVPKAHEFGLLVKGQETYLAYEEKPLMPLKELPIEGKHYQANAAAALALGVGIDLPLAPMLAVLREFQGLPHRCQFVRERLGVRWFNDSKGTNVGATQAAIVGLGSAMKGGMVLIAGGIGKHADFSQLVPAMEKYVRHVILLGEAAEEIAKVIGVRIPYSFALSMDDAVLQAADIAKDNDFVLLSPACASFDMFQNFEHRGEVFMDRVRKL